MEILEFLEKSYPDGIDFEGEEEQKEALMFSIVDDYINSEPPEQKSLSYGEIAMAQDWIISHINNKNEEI